LSLRFKNLRLKYLKRSLPIREAFFVKFGLNLYIINMEQPYHLIFEDSQSFKDYSLNDETRSITYIPNFSTINIIVGANNSGKSRFMRYLMGKKKFTKIDVSNFEKYNILV